MTTWTFCFALLLLLPTRTFAQKSFTVRGNSMLPLLKDGDEVFLAADKKDIARGDIVILKFAAREAPIVKKVYGIPGDAFQLPLTSQTSCQLKVNSRLLKNSQSQNYVFSERACKMLRLYEKDYRGKIPANSFLVLGEQVEGSLDSSAFGLADRSQILGIALKK